MVTHLSTFGVPGYWELKGINHQTLNSLFILLSNMNSIVGCEDRQIHVVVSFCLPTTQVKKVHEQLKALSGSKKKRKSVVLPIPDMDDPLFLPASLAAAPPAKKKSKKKSSKVESATAPVVKKANKLRSNPPAPAAPHPGPQPAKKSSTK